MKRKEHFMDQIHRERLERDRQEAERQAYVRGLLACAESRRQELLFAGMDCLPGQRDLFETDGEAEPESF
jgi:hypothetical protein